MADTLEEILTMDVLIDYAEAIEYPTVGLFNRLFPQEKDPYLEARWFSMMQDSNVPIIGEIYADDTEAKLSQRKPMKEIEVEKLTIKKMFSQSERLQKYIRRGATDANSQLDFLLNDARNAALGVSARMDVMCADLLSTGVVTIHENNANTIIDYQVPTSNKVAFDWSNPDHDILTDIQNMINVSESQGQSMTTAVMTPEIKALLMKNNIINKRIYGAANAGAFVTESMLKTLFDDMFSGLSIEVFKDIYQFELPAGGFGTRRYIDPNKFILVAEGTSGIGAGLWGETAEELEPENYNRAEPFDNNVFLCTWRKPEPVTKYIKAVGIGVPALWNPFSLNIADIVLSNTGTLGSLTVASAAGTETGHSAVTVAGNTGALKYKVAANPTPVQYGQAISSGYSNLTGTSPYDLDLTGDAGQQIYIVEVDSDSKAVAAGQATIVVAE